MSSTNATRTVEALRAFGFAVPSLNADLFMHPDQIVRMGVPPHRIEVLTTIDGVTFANCRKRALAISINGIKVPVISLRDLKKNKRASGRHKDLDDLENLP